MIDICRKSLSSILLSVDLEIFNDRIITKVLYWLSDLYIIYQKVDNQVSNICLEKKDGIINEEEFNSLKIRINQDMIDFKTRDIVIQETKVIRELLLVKAFSATDEFDEKCLFPEVE